ncbi:MAG: hypothetical protein AAFU85_30210, partial [Planctomycetota bacterium]
NRGGNRPNLGNLGGSRGTSDASTDKRQDVEGTIWEFKVLDPKEKDPKLQTLLTGKFRIKQTSIFSVGEAKLVNGAGKLAEEPAAPRGEKRNGGKKDGESGNVRGQLQGLLSQRIKNSEEQTSGGDRIGDIAGGSNKYKYEFDQDDEYPLSGLVDVALDTKKNGVWSGNYEEFSGGKKVNRWRFEMRKIEE